MMHSMSLTLLLLLGVSHVRSEDSDDADLVCAVDEKADFVLEKILDDAVILRTFRDKKVRDDCYQECCDLAESEGCSAATIYSDDQGPVCTLVNCGSNFTHCMFKEQSWTWSARIGLVPSGLLNNFTFENGDPRDAQKAKNNSAAANDTELTKILKQLLQKGKETKVFKGPFVAKSIPENKESMHTTKSSNVDINKLEAKNTTKSVDKNQVQEEHTMMDNKSEDKHVTKDTKHKEKHEKHTKLDKKHKDKKDKYKLKTLKHRKKVKHHKKEKKHHEEKPNKSMHEDIINKEHEKDKVTNEYIMEKEHKNEQDKIMDEYTMEKQNKKEQDKLMHEYTMNTQDGNKLDTIMDEYVMDNEHQSEHDKLMKEYSMLKQLILDQHFMKNNYLENRENLHKLKKLLKKGKDQTSIEYMLRNMLADKVLLQDVFQEGWGSDYGSLELDGEILYGPMTTMSYEQYEEEVEEEVQHELDEIFHDGDNWNVDDQPAENLTPPTVDDSSNNWDDEWNQNIQQQPGTGEEQQNVPTYVNQDLEYDYDLSPMAIFGLLVFVLTLLLLMIVLVRKIVQTQRLNYRPLGDKLDPPPTDYDADDWDEVNTHLVRSG